MQSSPVRNILLFILAIAGIVMFAYSPLAAQPISVTASSNSPVCEGSTLNLFANASGGTEPYTYVWAGPNGFSANVQNPSIANVTLAASGSYIVTVTDANDSIATSSIQVTVNPTATVNTVSNVAYCNGATTLVITFTGPVAGTTYTWTNSDPSIGLAASGTGNIQSFTATNNGTTPVVATITVTPTAN